MTIISLVLDGPYQPKLLKAFWDVSAVSGVEFKRAWTDGAPVHSVNLRCAGVSDEAEVLRAMMSAASEQGLGYRLFRSWEKLGAQDLAEADLVTQENVLRLLEGAVRPGEGPGTLEIARRALCLIAVHLKGMGDAEQASKIVSERGLSDALSPSERSYLAGEAGDGDMESRDVEARWGIEAAAVMLAALGLLPLGPVTAISDVPAIAGVVRGKTPAQLAGMTDAAAAEHALAEVLDDLEGIYQMHWRLRDARLNGRPDPEDFEPGVVIERHRAMAWLDTNAPWDEVDTST